MEWLPSLLVGVAAFIASLLIIDVSINPSMNYSVKRLYLAIGIALGVGSYTGYYVGKEKEFTVQVMKYEVTPKESNEEKLLVAKRLNQYASTNTNN